MAQLESLRMSALDDITKAQDARALDEVRVKYAGRKGLLPSLTKSLANTPLAERPAAGALLNDVKTAVDQALRVRREEMSKAGGPRPPIMDVTLPGRSPLRGTRHILTQMIEEIVRIFRGMGFEFVEGPEVETEYYNFDALNTPRDHPARDMQATLYVNDGRLLRTHTSPVQIRAMERRQPPLHVFTVGRCRRADMPDASHGMTFYQLEGLMVGKDVHFGHLKGVLQEFFSALYGPGTDIRLTPSFFPFTEPSVEVAARCVKCRGSQNPTGCHVCKGTGWLELFGAGMVHPNVFRAVGYDPEAWQGFAFGGGVERLAMIKHEIDDLRLFFQNDLRFLEQFR